MAVGVLKAWSTTAASNASADSNINLAEGQTPASLNDSGRAAMAAIKAFANQITAAKTSGGSANAQTLTSDAPGAISTAYAAGMMFVFKAGFTNSTTTPTFNVDGVGAKTIKKGGAQAALAASDIVAGGVYIVAYEASGDCFLLLNPESGQIAAQPLDATLTALAALAWSSGNQFPYFTAADTLSLGSMSANALTFNAAANYAAMRTALGVPALTGGNTFSGDQSIAGSVATTGGSAGLFFEDRTGSADWGWYCSSNTARLYNGSADVVTVDTSGNVEATSLRGRIPLSSETSGTLTSASANKRVKATGGVTINDGVFTAEDAVEIYNDSDVSITITQDTGMTLRLAGTTTTGNRSLAARGIAYIYFDTNADAAVAGSGVS